MGRESVSEHRAHARAGWLRLLTAFVVLVTAVVVTPAAIYQVVYADLAHPGVSSLGRDLTGLSAAEAKNVLAAEFAQYALSDLTLVHDGREWRHTPGALGLRLDIDATVGEVMAHGRSGPIWQQLPQIFSAWREGAATAPVLVFDQERAAQVVANLAGAIDQPMVNASLVTRPNGTVEVLPSRVGRKVDATRTTERLGQALVALKSDPVEVVVEETPPRVVESQLEAAKETAQRLLSGPIRLVHGPEAVDLDIEQLTGMLVFRDEDGGTVAELDEEALADAVRTMAERIDSQPRDAVFRFKGGRVQVTSESIDGARVDVDESVAAVREAALGKVRIVPLVVTTLPPRYRSDMASEILIREKLVEAQTVYGDTGADRQHNVRLAVSRLDGVLVPPGGTFSFNEALGPTRLVDGYKMGWGIVRTQDGHETIPSEAGGICQVSTTLFHTVFWVGLRVDQRTEHLYWIPRYGKPPLGRTGLDSTVDGSGSADTLDFKFTNNTPNWLAVEGRSDAMNMYFALYGTKSTWTVEVGEPVISNVVKTDPAQVRTFDPNLMPGEEVWVESAQDGFDVSIRRVVREGGTVLSELVVKSRYRPARNVIRFGPPLPTPTATPQPRATADASLAPAPAETPTEPTSTPEPN